ncbi:MAG: hypothetical protein AAF449_20785, partial [Myxococcota bacterium]
AQLEGLHTLLDDPEITEILIAGPDRVFISRQGAQEAVSVGIDERRIRSLADRRHRAFSDRPGEARREVCAGLISSELRAVVIGAARGGSCPMIRLVRDARSFELSSETADAFALSSVLEAMIGQRRSVVFCSPQVGATSAHLAAMAGRWMAMGRVAVIAAEGRFDDQLGHLAFVPEQGVEAAVAAAASVIVVPEPFPSIWFDLVQSGRPFISAFEAPDADAAVARLVAWILTAASELSRQAAEALVAASIDRIVTVSGFGGPEQLWMPVIRHGSLQLAPMDDPAQPSLERQLGEAAPSFSERGGSAIPVRAHPEGPSVRSDSNTSSRLEIAAIERVESDISSRLEVPALGRPAGDRKPSNEDEPTRAGSWEDLEDDQAGRPRRSGRASVRPDSDASRRESGRAPTIASGELLTGGGLPVAKLSPLDVEAPHELRATQAAAVEEMLSGHPQLEGAGMPTIEAPSGLVDIEATISADGGLGREPLDRASTPVGPMFEGRDSGAGRARRPRRPDPRRRRGPGSSGRPPDSGDKEPE